MSHRALLVLALAALPTIACSPPPVQTADQKYCEEMTELYDLYIGSTMAYSGVQRRFPPDAVGDTAVAQCRAGLPGTSILVLEQKLTDAKVALPARK